jgi:23S rRNA (cytosine1962-C5)-methyltransferase
VLDVCCYTGGFALHAARGGAGRVVAIDTSEAALAELAAGSERNGLPGIEARRGKASDVLRDLAAAKERFAGIVLDPPAFARSGGEVEGAWRGYVDLNARAMALLEPGGWLVTCSCSYNVRPEMFRAILGEAAARSGRSILDRGRLPPALDHPVLVGLPESDYLKVHWLEVVSD